MLERRPEPGGTWSVNLRIHQRDLSWKDEVKAEARIHSILRGKALLELWDGGGIKGMSLRHFDTARRKWVMWLDWPGRNRSTHPRKWTANSSRNTR